MNWLSEMDFAGYPVNQRIESGEPVVSEDNRARQVEVGDKKREGHKIAGWKPDFEVESTGDVGVRRAIK